MYHLHMLQFKQKPATFTFNIIFKATQGLFAKVCLCIMIVKQRCSQKNTFIEPYIILHLYTHNIAHMYTCTGCPHFA